MTEDEAVLTMLEQKGAPDIVKRQMAEAMRLHDKSKRGEELDPTEMMFVSLTLELDRAMNVEDDIHMLLHILEEYLYRDKAKALQMAVEGCPCSDQA